MATVNNPNVLGNLRLEMIDQCDRGCCNRTVVDMHQDHHQVTSIPFEEHGLVNITPCESELQHYVHKLLVPMPSRLLKSIQSFIESANFASGIGIVDAWNLRETLHNKMCLVMDNNASSIFLCTKNPFRAHDIGSVQCFSEFPNSCLL